MLESRIDDGAMRVGICGLLCLPQTDAAEAQPCAHCGATAAANPREGQHAHLCAGNTTRQKVATLCATAFVAVVQTLPNFKILGPKLTASLKVRPAEPSFAFLRDIGAVLVKPTDADRRADVAFRTYGGAWHAIDFKKVAGIQGGNLKAACAKQGVAVKAGDSGKTTSYQLSISNFVALRQKRIHFGVVDDYGNLSKGYDKVLMAIASHAYPGNGLLGKWDVDGLRSRCVARLRAAVGAGCWRATTRPSAAGPSTLTVTRTQASFPSFTPKAARAASHLRCLQTLT